jgi:hypothetical protein
MPQVLTRIALFGFGLGGPLFDVRVYEELLPPRRRRGLIEDNSINQGIARSLLSAKICNPLKK